MAADDIESGEREAAEFLNEDLRTRPSVSGEAGDSVFGSNARTGSSGGAVQEILRQSSHPTAALFHLGFKIGAVASYILIGFFTRSFVIQFVVTVTLLAFDFWTVKNVTGRLLVGLRWWNDAGEGGDSQWRFETVQDRSLLNAMDGRIFWGALYLTPVVWVALGVICVLKFNLSYLVIVAIALVLSAANMVGYYKCDKSATEQLRTYIGKTVLGHAMEQTGIGVLGQFVSK